MTTTMAQVIILAGFILAIIIAIIVIKKIRKARRK